YPV
ncbi:binding--dependent transport system inner membrane component family protein, partial [Chlamydia psittaci C1/97]